MTKPQPTNDRPASGCGAVARTIPEGWISLDESPGHENPVDGLLNTGVIVEAEWWEAVPHELQTPGEWDGSGWAWNASRQPWGGGFELIAWRPRDGTGRDPSPPQVSGDKSREDH